MKSDSQKFKFDCELYQGVLAGMGLLFLLIVTMLVSHNRQNKRDFNFSMGGKNLFARDVKELVGTKQALELSDFWHYFVAFTWFIGLASLLVLEESKVKNLFTNMTGNEEILRYCAFGCTAATSIISLIILLQHLSVKSFFSKCNCASLDRTSKLLRLDH